MGYSSGWKGLEVVVWFRLGGERYRTQARRELPDDRKEGEDGHGGGARANKVGWGLWEGK